MADQMDISTLNGLFKEVYSEQIDIIMGFHKTDLKEGYLKNRLFEKQMKELANEETT